MGPEIPWTSQSLVPSGRRRLRHGAGHRRPALFFRGARVSCILTGNELEDGMTRKLLTALILIGLTVLVLVFNARGPSVSVNLGFASVSGMKSLVFLCFTAIGVAIGVLIH